MDVPPISYITETEVVAQTAIAALKTVPTADITLMIQTAEDQIDQYVGPQPHHQYDANLQRVFPRPQDYHIASAGIGFYEYVYIPEVPYKVSRACLRQVEWLYTQWYPNRTTDQLPTEYAVEQQDVGGDGSYAGKRAFGGTAYADASLSEQAKALLQGFVSRTAGIGVTDPRTTPWARRDNPIRFNVPF